MYSTTMNPNKALIVYGKIQKYCNPLYLYIEPQCKSASRAKWSVYKCGRSTDLLNNSIHIHYQLFRTEHSTMDNQSPPPPWTPISSILAGINPDEFDDPEFSDDGSSLLSSGPNTLMTPVFGSSSRSADSSESDTTTGPGTAGSTIFKRKKIKRKS